MSDFHDVICDTGYEGSGKTTYSCIYDKDDQCGFYFSPEIRCKVSNMIFQFMCFFRFLNLSVVTDNRM